MLRVATLAAVCLSAGSVQIKAFGNKQGVAVALADEALAPMLTVDEATDEPQPLRRMAPVVNPSGLDTAGKPYQQCDMTKPPGAQQWLVDADGTLLDQAPHRMNIRASFLRCYGLWHNSELSRIRASGKCSNVTPFVKRLESGFMDSQSQIKTEMNVAFLTGRLFFVADTKGWGEHALDLPFEWDWAPSKDLFCNVGPEHRGKPYAAGNLFRARDLKTFTDGLHRQRVADASSAGQDAPAFEGQAMHEVVGLASGFQQEASGFQQEAGRWNAPEHKLDALRACHKEDGPECHRAGLFELWIYFPNEETQALMNAAVDQVPAGNFMLGWHYRSHFVKTFVDNEDMLAQVDQVGK